MKPNKKIFIGILFLIFCVVVASGIRIGVSVFDTSQFENATFKVDCVDGCDQFLVNASLENLTDVSMVNKTTGDIIIYNGSEWINSNLNETINISSNAWIVNQNQDVGGGIKTGSYSLNTTGNVTANYFIGDGSQLTGINESDTLDNVCDRNCTTDQKMTVQSGNGKIAILADDSASALFYSGSSSVSILDSSRAGYFSSAGGTTTATLADGNQAIYGYHSSGNYGYIGDSSYGATFYLNSGSAAVSASDTSSNVAELATGSYPAHLYDNYGNYVYAGGGSAYYSLESYWSGSGGSGAGYFWNSYGDSVVMADSSYALSAYSGGSGAGYFYEGSNEVYLSDGTNAITTEGDIIVNTGKVGALSIETDNIYGIGGGQISLFNSQLISDALAIDYYGRYLYASDGSTIMLDWGMDGTADFQDNNITTTGTICDGTGCIGDIRTGVNDTLGAVEYGYYNSTLLYLKIEMNTTIAGTNYLTGIAIVNDTLGIRRVEGNLSAWI